MRGLIDHGIAGRLLSKNDYQNRREDTYKIYFGLGQSVSLAHAPGVFEVSLAGIRFGNHLVQLLTSNSSAYNRSFLDIGTGSGVHALLLRKLGGKDITATDVCEKSITQAKINESINFKQHAISFLVSDLFDGLPERKFQTIVFNPPGWRTPSHALTKRLERQNHVDQLPIRAMFYGEEVLGRFLEQLPNYLDATGMAVVGLNSLAGIRDVLNRYDRNYNNQPPLTYKLVERHTFPLIHYSEQWKSLDKYLKLEFESWSDFDVAAYSIDQSGNIYWPYEIIVFSLRNE